MLLVGSALKGYAIEASDGRMGTVNDFLFDDQTWKIRWLVVDTGTWLTGRKVLIHPSALGQSDYEARELSVALTKDQVKNSPDIANDAPVSMQMQTRLYDYYGWDPLWGGGSYGMGAIASPISSPPYFGATEISAEAMLESQLHEGDPHLRGLASVTGYHIHARDGTIGHLESVIIDDAQWQIDYLIVDSKNWWPGKHVLISPTGVMQINWLESVVALSATRAQVKSSPPWNPADLIDEAYRGRLHGHYGWPPTAA